MTFDESEEQMSHGRLTHRTRLQELNEKNHLVFGYHQHFLITIPLRRPSHSLLFLLKLQGTELMSPVQQQAVFSPSLLWSGLGADPCWCQGMSCSLGVWSSCNTGAWELETGSVLQDMVDCNHSSLSYLSWVMHCRHAPSHLVMCGLRLKPELIWN